MEASALGSMSAAVHEASARGSRQTKKSQSLLKDSAFDSKTSNTVSTVDVLQCSREETEPAVLVLVGGMLQWLQSSLML